MKNVVPVQKVKLRPHWLVIGAMLAATSLLPGCAGDSQTAASSSPSAKNQIAEPKPDLLIREAVQLMKADRLEDAQAKINEALRLRVDKSYYHFLNALIYHIQACKGDRAAFDLAEQGYNMAVQFDKANWLAYYFRGRMWIDMNRFELAEKDLAEALIYSPNDLDILESFAYASYRSGHPDAAAGAIKAMEKTGKPLSPQAARNAALIMAAVGEQRRANEYLNTYKKTPQNSPDAQQELDRLKRRIQEWGSVRKTALKATPVQYDGIPAYSGGNGAPSTGFNSGASSFSSSMPRPDVPTAAGSEDKMVVIDVIMIGTSEDIFTTKGVNLLNGLSIQFGALDAAAGGFPAFQTTEKKTNGFSTLTSAITIPAVSYSLNIFNANNNRNEVLARPTLVGLAGKPSEFFSGVELNAAAVGGGLGSSSINIDKEIGVKLNVTPAFLPDGRLKLQVSAERTFLQTTNNNGVTFQYQIQTSKDKVNANVVMRYGETLILGGLSLKETENGRDGVPVLQDIPGLQYLFSHQTKHDFQSSVLILMTPRPTQYVYQPDKARQEYEQSLSEDERPLANLRARYSDWFQPYPNWASVFHHLQENGLYREFRTGDVALETWTDMRTLQDRLNQALEFLHY